ncbi:MAG: hypothetical protein ACE366_15865 [Bradymonadia bacterium]
MKKVWILGLLTLMAMPVSAVAQIDSQADEKVQFFQFEKQDIEGENNKPVVVCTTVRQKAKFARLLHLKKDFLSQVKATGSDLSLR